MKHILLVEDEEMLVNVLATVLQEEGFVVRKSTSAEEALEVLPGFRPDLIISDVKLAEMDGFTMLEHIRADKQNMAVPFICLTALDDAMTAKKAKQLGAAAYMTKPFDVDDLVKMVREILENSEEKEKVKSRKEKTLMNPFFTFSFFLLTLPLVL